MAKKKKKKVISMVPPQPQAHQYSLPLPPRWTTPQQLRLEFPKHVRPVQPPKPFQMVFTGFVGGYQRDGIFNREDVFNFLYQEREFGNDIIKLVSQRYFLFAQNHVCVRCGLEGLYFAKERSARIVKVQLEGTGRHTTAHEPINGERSAWHLNLYALKRMPNGEIKEIMMTKDHILPRAKGGEDRMDNYQTMCSICNGHKGDKLDFSPATHIAAPVTLESVADEPLLLTETLTGKVE